MTILGLFFAVVFLAVPQLRSARRNDQRRVDLGKIIGEIENYATNNGGDYPDSVSIGCNDGSDSFDDFATTYFEGLNIFEPIGRSDYQYMCDAAEDPVDVGIIQYAFRHTCDGEAFAPGGDNQVAVRAVLEPGNVYYCQDNL